MEAATPLNPTRVRSLGDRVVVDGLLVTDETAVRLVREREAAGDDPVRLVTDAIAIGARVLDREQVGANADFVKTEFEKASGELQREFGDQAREVTEQLEAQLKAVFADDSSGAVQHKVRDIVREVMAKSREEMLQQFSSADGKNPLADFKDATVRSLNRAGEVQEQQLRALTEKLGALQLELQGLRAEKEKLEEIAAVEDKGTAKGRTYEEAVVEAVDAIAHAQGDVAEAVGDRLGNSGRVGDVVVSIDACSGPARGRIVFEAKNSRKSRPAAMQELDDARADRSAQFAVMVVPSDEKVPAKTNALREYNGDKMIVVYDPEDGSTLSLEVAYSLARARVLLQRGNDDGLDVTAVHEAAQRALDAMDEVRSIKQKLTGAKTSIDSAAGVLDGMASRVRELLGQVTELTAQPASDD